MLNKIDLLVAEDVDAAVAEWRERLGGEPQAQGEDGPVVIAGSTVTGAGLAAVRGTIFSMVPEPEQEAAPEEAASPSTRSTGPRTTGSTSSARPTARSGSRGRPVERLVERHDLENPDALAYIEERLKAMGVVKRLEARGFEPGDEVEIGDVAFALYPGVPQE